MAERRAKRLLKLSDLGRLSEKTFDNFNPDGVALNEQTQRNLRSAHEAARAFAENPSGWLLITGTFGCGKTHLAAAIANRIIQRGKAVLFVVVPDLLDHLRSAYAPTSLTTYDQRFEEVRNAPCLILDDLGAHNATPWAIEKLYQILNYRYNNRLPTVITSNVPLTELDPRLRSRLSDASLVRRIAIIAPDYRSGAPAVLADLSTLPLHVTQTFDTFDLRERELDREDRQNLYYAFVSAREYAANPTGWIAFLGDHYSGKTHLAAAIANSHSNRGYPVLFVPVPDLLDYLRSAFDPASPVSYDKRFHQVKMASLLVLDDLGSHSATPWAQEKLHQLLNYRFNANLPTVITTTLALEQIDLKLKTRLMDKSRCLIVPVIVPAYTGRSRRSTVANHESRH